MATIVYNQLTKIQKIAAFFIFIGAEAASEVMKGFDTAQLELICREMTNLHVIDEAVQTELIAEFGELIVTGMHSKLGGVGYAQSVLAKAKGDYTAASILNRVAPSTLPSEADEDIRQMDGRQILNLMKSEQPQTVAYLLSYLDTPKAAEIVSMLAPELREEVVERLGAMEPTTHEVLLKIARNLNRHFDKKALHQGLHHSGGVKNVADILNSLDKDMRKVLLTRIEERNAALGAAIRKKVFSFEDLTRLDRVDLQRVLREVDMSDLAVALKLAKPVLVNAVMTSISKRAAEGLREDMDMLGPVKMKDVEAAQDKIIQVVRKLEETEEITLDTGGDDRVFV
jgi:flagellar motor switch protein FliG